MIGPPTVSQILSSGLSSAVMVSRTAVLRSEGYLVIETFTIPDCLRLFSATDIDLALLCQSIGHSQQAQLAMIMKSIKCSTPVMALHYAFDVVEEADYSLNSLAGPEALLECVAELLRKRSTTGKSPKRATLQTSQFHKRKVI